MRRRSQSGWPNKARYLSLPLAACIAASPLARAEDPAPTLEEVVVTAQKRSEDLQNVPISVDVMDAKRLEDLHVSDFNSVAKFLPSLSFQTLGPGQAQIYFRGITNGSDGLKTGSSSTVGVYLDEQPVTTIGTALDIHVYDMERIEALSGPQGTLFGASSMAGTVRYITNKPDTSHTYGGYDLFARQTAHGGWGDEIDGFLNLALSDHVAVRLVGYTEFDPGYINNVAGPYQVYPTSGVVRDNSAFRAKDYNSVGTTGGRAALKFDFDNSWTVSPDIIYQKQDANGSFGYNSTLGYLNVATFSPMVNEDQWYQAALTVTGKIGNFDVVYSGGYSRRTIVNIVDYSDYSLAYDIAYANNPSYFGDLFLNNAGQPISPAQTLVSYDLLTKRTHEVRLSSPVSDAWHFVLGAFYEKQTDDNEYRYEVAGLGTADSVTGQPGVHYENVVTRRDVDRALFADVTGRLSDHWTVIAGVRAFDFNSQAQGFFGFNSTYNVGEALCKTLPDPANPRLPCNDVNAGNSGGKYTDRVSLDYRPMAGRLFYATYSTGFRQGGFNRNPTIPGYKPDYLTNYELGWKTEWAGRRLRFNGAVFREDWKDMQWAVAGQYAVTEILNAGGARAEGIESSLQWLIIPGLTFDASATYLWKHQLTEPACATADAEALPNCGGVSGQAAAAGATMPVSPPFKANATLRYDFSLDGHKAWAQAAAVYQNSSRTLLADADEAVVGATPAWASVDANIGFQQDRWSLTLNVENLFDSHGEISRYLICSSSFCTQPYAIPIRPRTITIQFAQKF